MCSKDKQNEYVDRIALLFSKVVVPMCNEKIIKKVIKDYDSEVYNFINKSEENYKQLIKRIVGIIAFNELSEPQLYHKVFYLSKKESMVYSDFNIINAEFMFVLENMHDNTCSIYICVEDLVEDIYKKTGEQLSKKKTIINTKDIELPNQWIFIGAKELLSNKFNHIRNNIMWTKPEGGLWSSSYTPTEKYISSWHKWCSKTNNTKFLTKDSVTFSLKQNSRVYIIDKKIDLKNLIDKYELKYDMDFCKLYKFIDYEKVSRDYDAIYLTENGLYENTDALFSMVKGEREYNLMGWDCETLLILDFNIIENCTYVEFKI